MGGERTPPRKKQHYVPQFLLKPFSTGNKHRLWVFDKRTGRKWNQGVKEIASKRGFYDLGEANGRTGSAEAALSRMESAAAPLLKRLWSSKSLGCLSAEDRIILALFVAAQMLRTAHVRAMYDETDEMLRELAGIWNIPRESLGCSNSRGADESTRHMVAGLIEDTPEFAEILLQKVWVLLEASRGATFYISDNPVTRHNLVDRPLRGNLGIKCEGIEVYLPISPTLTLLLLCEKMAAAKWLTAVSEMDVQGLHAMEAGTPIRLRRDNVIHLNSLQVQQAERFVYSQRDEFALAKEMMGAHPELRQGPRSEVMSPPLLVERLKQKRGGKGD